MSTRPTLEELLQLQPFVSKWAPALALPALIIVIYSQRCPKCPPRCPKCANLPKDPASDGTAICYLCTMANSRCRLTSDQSANSRPDSLNQHEHMIHLEQGNFDNPLNITPLNESGVLWTLFPLYIDLVAHEGYPGQLGQADSYIQTGDLWKTTSPVDVPSQGESNRHELTDTQHDLQTLYVGIWKAEHRHTPLRVAIGLDTLADANFISVDRVNELGYVLANLPRYTDSAFSTVCGGEVYPVARISLKWHYLRNPSTDYEDEFLVINTTEVGCVLGIKTIEQRAIFFKGPKFQRTGLKPLDKKTEKKLKDNAVQRRREEAAGRLDEMRRGLIAGQSGRSGGSSSQSTEWSDWTWHAESRRHWCSRVDEQGKTDVRWSAEVPQ